MTKPKAPKVYVTYMISILGRRPNRWIAPTLCIQLTKREHRQLSTGRSRKIKQAFRSALRRRSIAL